MGDTSALHFDAIWAPASAAMAQDVLPRHHEGRQALFVE